MKYTVVDQKRWQQIWSAQIGDRHMDVESPMALRGWLSVKNPDDDGFILMRINQIPVGMVKDAAELGCELISA